MNELLIRTQNNRIGNEFAEMYSSKQLPPEPKRKPYHLFLDDYRHPYDCIGYAHSIGIRPDVYTTRKWRIAKSYKEFVDTILWQGQLPLSISFDHDLADVHYDIDFQDWNDYTADQLGIEETGMDCAKWLINYCLNNELPLPEYFVHSMNPVGRQNIKSLLDNYKKYENGIKKD